MSAASSSSRKLAGVDPITSQKEYSRRDSLVLQAVDRYKREKNRPFVTCIEIAHICYGITDNAERIAEDAIAEDAADTVLLNYSAPTAFYKSDAN
jgi:hypothetical protein